MKKLVLGVLIWACAYAAVDRPVLGYVQDSRGALHALQGMAGAFTVGPAVGDAEAYIPVVMEALERRDAGFYVLDRDGGVADILPPEAVCALLMPRGAIHATGDEVVLGEVRLPLAGVRALRAVSDDFVQASTHDGEFLVRAERGREAVFALPAIPVESLEVVE